MLEKMNEFLQRNLIIEVVSNPTSNLVGCIFYVKFKAEEVNITTLALEEKLATVVDWMVKGTTYEEMYKPYRV